MKAITFCLIVCILLLVFGFVYGFVLYKLDYGAVDYDEYMKGTYEGFCEFKEAGYGFTQLPNCAKYKLKQKSLIRISIVE